MATPNTPQKPGGFGKFSRTLSFWLIAFLIPIVLIQYAMKGSEAVVEVDASVYYQQLDAGNISKVTVIGGKEIVGEFRNRTLEHIAVGTFVRDLERAYITSGSVRVVASAAERDEVRGERADQQTNASAETRARMAREQGARFMLQGDVQAIEDSEGREKIVFYQIDATLIDLETNAKVWVGQHKIKKYIQRRRLTP